MIFSDAQLRGFRRRRYGNYVNVPDVHAAANLGYPKLSNYVNVPDVHAAANLGYPTANTGAFGSFGWDGNQQQSWCQQNYGSDAGIMAKCMDNSFPNSLSPPWTDMGKLSRGLPAPLANVVRDTGQLVGGGGGGGAPPGGAPRGGGAMSSVVGGIPAGALMVGAAILGLGAVVYVLKKRRKGRK